MPITRIFSKLFAVLSMLLLAMNFIAFSSTITGEAQLQLDCPDGQFFLNQSECLFGCPDPNHLIGPRGYCYCPAPDYTGDTQECEPVCETYDQLTSDNCEDNPYTFRRKFLRIKNSERFLNIGPRGELYFNRTNLVPPYDDGLTPLILTYTKDYQLKHRGMCLNVELGSVVELINCTSTTPDTKIALTDNGNLVPFASDEYAIANTYAHYASQPVVDMYFTPIEFEIVNSPFTQENCEAGKIKVNNKCVCDPEIMDSECENNDGEICTERREYRLGNECVPLREINRINNLFRRYYNTGFWIN